MSGEWVADAAKRTRQYVSDKINPTVSPAALEWHLNPALSDAVKGMHVADMLRRIQIREITGTKAHRWLGWAQACIVFAGIGTLDDMKRINKEASDAHAKSS